MHNFIPWDIDGDFNLPNNTIHHFHKNGKARIILEDYGITFHSWDKDNYGDKDAGHYELLLTKNKNSNSCKNHWFVVLLEGFHRN